MSAPTEPGAVEQPDAIKQPDRDSAAPPGSDVAAKVPEFAELSGSSGSADPTSLDHLLDVNVTLTVELGRVVLPIGEVLKLGVGGVLELNRPVTEPVDLMAQGVRLARGEVVVVDDRFAVRIKEIIDPKKRG